MNEPSPRILTEQVSNALVDLLTGFIPAFDLLISGASGNLNIEAVEILTAMREQTLGMLAQLGALTH